MDDVDEKKRKTDDEEAKKLKKKKKKKSNQSSVDFVIVSKEGDVKEVVKKKKKKKDGEAKTEEGPKKTKKKRKKEGDEEVPAAGKEEKRKKVSEEVAAAGKERSLLLNNPSGCTRLFLGNLPWTVDKDGINEALGCEATHIKYITDKETKMFYGSAFVEVGDPEKAANAVGRSGILVGGREINIKVCPPRPGDIWPPPVTNEIKQRDRTPRPDGGTTRLFVGNVAYEATEDDVLNAIKKTLEKKENPVRDIRWLTHRDTGEFKGSGFIDFFSIHDADAVIKNLDGFHLKGRNLRIDYTSTS